MHEHERNIALSFYLFFFIFAESVQFLLFACGLKGKFFFDVDDID